MLHLFYGIKPLLGLALLSIKVTCNLLGIPAHDSSSFHRTPLRGRDDSFILVSPPASYAKLYDNCENQHVTKGFFQANFPLNADPVVARNLGADRWKHQQGRAFQLGLYP